jgi:hypothetical protein
MTAAAKESEAARKAREIERRRSKDAERETRELERQGQRDNGERK